MTRRNSARPCRLGDLMDARLLATTIAAAAWAGPALACTLCHSQAAISVRHQLLEHDLAANAAAVAAPIPLLLGAILLIARQPRKRRNTDGR